MREMTMTMTTKVSHRFASTTSRRGGRRATTVRAAGTVRRSEINQSSSTSTGSRARFALVATFARTRARASLTLARLHARRAGDLGRRRALRSTDFIHNSPPRRAQNSSEFEAPNQYGYFPSAIEAAKQKRATQQGFDTQVKMTKEEQQARFKGLCAKHPELQKCQSDYVSPLRVKPSTQSVINGSVVRSDGIILVPGNKEDLITWALDPAMSIRAAFLTIAGACLRHYRRNEALLLVHYEERALHQARVAVRRLRSALTLFKPVLLEADVARFQQELRWLAGMLGEARDLDVLHGRLADDAQAAIGQARAQSHARVREWLESARVRGLLLDIAEWLALGAGCGGAADEPVADFAAGRLQKLHKRVAKGGDDLAQLPPDTRHKVRKDAKKLRYGSEFFAGLYSAKKPRKAHGAYVGALEKLQDKLGDLNDLATAPSLFARYHLSEDTPLGLKSEKQLLRKAEKAHDALAQAPRFWR